MTTHNSNGRSCALATTPAKANGNGTNGNGTNGNGTPANPFNGRRYLKIAETSSFLGLSQPTVRQLVDSGEIASFRTIAGHRRLDTLSVLTYAYGDDWQSNGETGKKVVCVGYIRVSSKGQNTARGSSQKSSLDHQRERIQAYALEHYQTDDLTIFEDVGSGMNLNREGLNCLLRQVMAGELRGGVILATDFSRLARFSYDLIKSICDFGGVEIVFTMDEREAKTENETLIDDILGIMTHFTAKASGAKSAKILTIHVDPEAMKRGWEIYQQYKSYRKTVAILEQEGFVDAKGRPYKLNVLRKAMIQNQDTLTELFGADTMTSFERFAMDHIRRGKQTDIVLRQDVIDAYHRWCEKQETEPMTSSAIGLLVKEKLGWTITHRKQNGVMHYVGIVLN